MNELKFYRYNFERIEC